MSSPRVFTVAPSDFAWLLDRCPRCFWRKTRGFQAPPSDLPTVFKAIDKGMKLALTVEVVNSLGIPATGVLEESERLKSAPFAHAGAAAIVSGRRDKTFVAADGGLIIAEFKTGKPDNHNVNKYWRQLHACEYSYRCPASGEPRQVDALWLVFYDVHNEGTSRFNVKDTAAALVARLVAVEVPINRAAFEAELMAVCETVALEEPPPSGPGCNFCALVADAARCDNGPAKKSVIRI